MEDKDTEEKGTMSVKDKEEVVTILISMSTLIDELEAKISALNNSLALTFFLVISVGGLMFIKWAIEAWKYAYGG
jgi:hypothetical protein